MKCYYIEEVGTTYMMTTYDLEHLYDLLCGIVSEEEALDAKLWAETAEIGETYRGSCFVVELGEEVL